MIELCLKFLEHLVKLLPFSNDNSFYKNLIEFQKWEYHSLNGVTFAHWARYFFFKKSVRWFIVIYLSIQTIYVFEIQKCDI